MPQPIYLDHNATTPLHPEVKRVMVEMLDVFGNPSSLHAFGREARARVEAARAQVAALVNADPVEVIFTGSGSEGNNTVLSLVRCTKTACRCDLGTRKGLVTTAIEHPCVLETAKYLRRLGHPVTILGVDRSGRIDLDELRAAVTPEVGLVSIMTANNETGTIQDIPEAARIAHEAGALFHTDAVQAVGKIPVDVRAWDVDFLTLSAHKIYGPKGVGALVARRGTPLCPLILGGHQEAGRRAGTENTIGIAAMGEAARMRLVEMDTEAPRLAALRDRLRQGIEAAIPDVSFNGHPEHTLPSTLNVSFMGVEGEAILLHLDAVGIAVSTGSACASGSLDPSHVIMALGVPVEYAHGSIRISLGRETTEEHIDTMLRELPPIIANLRSISSAYRRKS